MINQRIGNLSRGVSIVGIGNTHFGMIQSTSEILNFTERELLASAAIEAMEDANISAKDIDAFYIAQYMSETLSHSNSVAGAYADWLGLSLKPGFHMEAACTSSTQALRNAVQLVASGVHDVALVGSVETTSSTPVPGKPAHIREPLPNDELWEKTMYGTDRGYVYWGSPATTFDAQMSNYAAKYGLSRENLDDTLNQAAINNRRAAVLNPKAAMATMTMEEEAKENGFDNVMDYMRSDFNPRFSLTARLKHMAITCDGASALIVMPTEKAKLLSNRYVEVTGFGSSAATVAPMVEMEKTAFKAAYKMAGITNPRKELDYYSPHDCLMGRQIATPEIAGYFDPGEAWKYIIEGRTAYDGERPYHTSGGRSSLGHAWAASAALEVGEAVRQMRGEAGERQIKNPPKTALIHNEGAGPNVQATILQKL